MPQVRRHAVFLFAFLGLLAAFAHPASAGNSNYNWKNVVLGGGGYEPSILFSPQEKDLAYLRTDMGGLYRWDAKAGRWIPLEDALGSNRYFGIESLALDPKDANTVYIATGMYRGDKAAMLHSSDRGAHWDIHEVSFHMGGNEPGRGAGERLAIDPNDTATLYFGSRWDGLQKSTDKGTSWSKVEGFPPGTGFFVTDKGEVDYSKPVSIGVSFVVFDPTSGSVGGKTKTIYAGLADPGPHHLYRSDDAGKTWTPVPGEPRADFLPVHGAVDKDGTLYVVYSVNTTGPYGGMSNGGVFKLSKAGKWTDITPKVDADNPACGYGGLSIDPNVPGLVIVATAERWSKGDTLFRSTDGGAHWTDLKAASKTDAAATPFLKWGNAEPKFGWWMSGIAIDPFDPAHVAFTTGATVYATHDVGKPAMTWTPWIKGVEQTAVLSMISPPAGPHLVSAMADVGGFVHDDLNQSPPGGMMEAPLLGRTNVLDYAALAPNVMVRAGVPNNKGKDPSLSYSTDYGHHWTPLPVPALKGTDSKGNPVAKRYDLDGDIAVAVSADGKAIIAMTPIPMITRDFGKSWSFIRDLPFWSRIVTDRVNPNRFYTLDLANLKVLASEDGGASFKEVGKLYANIVYKWPTQPGEIWPLMATPGVEGDLWIKDGSNELYHSSDGGESFRIVKSNVSVDGFAFGKPADGKDYPTLFATGWNSPVRMIFRSTDKGKTWKRINDDEHQYGWMFKCLAGDSRIFGRVYVGTDGRGIVYGDPEE